MSDDKVIPFRPTSEPPKWPSQNELDAYRDMTKRWDRNLRELLFPQYFPFDKR